MDTEAMAWQFSSTEEHDTTSHRRAAAGVEEEIGGVGGNGRLVGDWPVAQRHAHDGRHVGLSAKDVDGDSSGFACGEKNKWTKITFVCYSWIVFSAHAFVSVIDSNIWTKLDTELLYNSKYK